MLRKISELKQPQGFVGQKLLLQAQARGLEIFEGPVDAPSAMLIGLAQMLVERGVLSDGEEDGEA